MVVLELLKWRAPPVLILLVVLLAANTKVPQTHDIHFVEMFAGDGAVSMALWEAGLRGSSHDVRYNKLMDLLTPHGFAFFGINFVLMYEKSWTVYLVYLPMFGLLTILMCLTWGWLWTRSGIPLLGAYAYLVFAATPFHECGLVEVFVNAQCV